MPSSALARPLAAIAHRGPTPGAVHIAEHGALDTFDRTTAGASAFSVRFRRAE